MKCWKCGKENAGGISACISCGTALNRTVPASEAGRALRQLYDRYGAETVLGNGAYVTNGLGDLMTDAKKLRNQLKMAMDVGMGQAYLEQLRQGRPDDAFDRRIRMLLTEEAGLNEKAAESLMGYFDEMIGWPTAKAGAITGGQTEPQRSTRRQQTPQESRMPPTGMKFMFLVFDLFRENGSVAGWAAGMDRNGSSFPCSPPWKKCSLKDATEEQMFSDYLARLLHMFGDKAERTAFVVPFDFTCLQKAKIRQIAAKLGIENVRFGSGIEYHALYHAETEGRFLFAQFENDRIELGLIETEAGVCEVLGITGIRVDCNDRSERVWAQLKAELNQLQKDLEYSNDLIDELLVFGNTFDPAVEWLEEAVQKPSVKVQNDAVKGAMRLPYAGIETAGEAPLLLQATSFDLSLALGEKGERGVVIPRYTTIPTKCSINLLVSTETTLQFYEGNYSNPRFDTEIGSVSVAVIPEGHEAECTIDIDANWIITLTVRNDRQEIGSWMVKYL